MGVVNSKKNMLLPYISNNNEKTVQMEHSKNYLQDNLHLQMTNFITVIKRDVSTMFCTDKLLCVNVRDYVIFF